MTAFRLQVAVAKIQQNIPELKRDGNNVLSSQCAQLLYAENSTNRATTVFTLMEFVPALQTLLADEPRKVVNMFEEIRKCCTCAGPQVMVKLAHAIAVTTPSGVRFSVTGNVLRVAGPRSTWARYFQDTLKVFSPLTPYVDDILI